MDDGLLSALIEPLGHDARLADGIRDVREATLKVDSKTFHVRRTRGRETALFAQSVFPVVSFGIFSSVLSGVVGNSASRREQT